MAKLTAKQQRFCDEYLIDLNATQAAIRAGYSPKTAEQLAYQLLQKTSVQNHISELQKKREERTEITQDNAKRSLPCELGRQMARICGSNKEVSERG